MNIQYVAHLGPTIFFIDKTIKERQKIPDEETFLLNTCQLNVINYDPRNFFGYYVFWPVSQKNNWKSKSRRIIKDIMYNIQLNNKWSNIYVIWITTFKYDFKNASNMLKTTTLSLCLHYNVPFGEFITALLLIYDCPSRLQ